MIKKKKRNISIAFQAKVNLAVVSHVMTRKSLWHAADDIVDHDCALNNYCISYSLIGYKVN